MELFGGVRVPILNFGPYFNAQHCLLAIAGVYTETCRWVLPLRIPKVEIDKLADELIDQFGLEAGEMADLEQDRAIGDCDPYNQGKWRRVRRAIDRRSM